jgi:hypothetical protein
MTPVDIALAAPVPVMTEDEIALILKRLAAFYSLEEAQRWLNAPHPQLNGRRAVDCPLAEVLAIIDRLESDAFL